MLLIVWSHVSSFANICLASCSPIQQQEKEVMCSWKWCNVWFLGLVWWTAKKDKLLYHCVTICDSYVVASSIYMFDCATVLQSAAKYTAKSNSLSVLQTDLHVLNHKCFYKLKENNLVYSCKLIHLPGCWVGAGIMYKNSHRSSNWGDVGHLHLLV